MSFTKGKSPSFVVALSFYKIRGGFLHYVTVIVSKDSCSLSFHIPNWYFAILQMVKIKRFHLQNTIIKSYLFVAYCIYTISISHNPLESHPIRLSASFPNLSHYHKFDLLLPYSKSILSSE